MKVAVLIRKGSNPGGAVASMETLSECLATEHEVEVFTVDPHRWMPDFQLPIEVKVFLQYIFGLFECIRMYGEIKDYDPDLVFSQHEPALLGSLLATPQVLFLRGSFFLNRTHEFEEDDGNMNNQKKVLESVAYITNTSLSPVNSFISDRVIRNSEMVLSNSEYTAAKYRSKNNIDSRVVYPFVETSDFKTEVTGESILHVNPSFHKGIDITLKVAEELPDHQFLIVGSEPEEKTLSRINNSDNINFHGYANNMRTIYKKSKIVIMPSRFEPYGRIPIEAGISGIPSIVANSGGLPESVGIDSLVVDENIPGLYVEKIKEVENNYDKYSTLSKENAKEKSVCSQIARLKRILREEACIDI